MPRTVCIGTRESRLAVIQAELVAGSIRQAHPELGVELVPMKTTGDKNLHKTLDKIGGKGVFVKELDEALRRGDVDLCVHSYKDMPTDIDPAIPIVAVSPREDARDVLILPAGSTALSPGAPIGCSSQRRCVQLERLFPGHPVAPVRGNVPTRLEKLDRGEYAALVLAAAGIKRLGLWERVSRVFSPEEMLPAGCQGVIAVQGRREDDWGYLRGFHDRDAWDATLAERAFIQRLACGCGAPVGVFGEVGPGRLRLRGLLAHNSRIHTAELSTGREDPARTGVELAERIMERAGLSCHISGE